MHPPSSVLDGSGAGRYAPSPSGDLHLGNLRTALLAWLFARSSGRRFMLRVEDLDRVRPGAEERQLRDLTVLGLDWDGEVVRQSERLELYADAVDRLRADGKVYECYCTRREIREAASAPHRPPGAYPGTCRRLTAVQRSGLRRRRPAALRLLAEQPEHTVHDLLHGDYTAAVDDVVLVRNDGVPAYNLAVVVDDAAQGVDQVVRGDDLLASTPRQAYLASVLALPVPEYAHVPLALGERGARLAKRDGAVTLADLADRGVGAAEVRAMLTTSLGMRPGTREEVLAQFSPERLPREPWVVFPA